MKESKHIEMTCKKLREMVSTLSDFSDLLERELTQIIGNAAFIVESKDKVSDLFLTIQEQKDELFEQHYAQNFSKLNGNFMNQTTKMEESIMEQIMKQFEHMKSSLDRFQMLEKFKVLEQKSIMKDSKNKFSDVLESYINDELKQYKNIFYAENEDPPVSKNIPP